LSTLKSVQLATCSCTWSTVRVTTRNCRSVPCATCSVEIGADQVPELLVFNKADVPGSRARELAALHEGSVLGVRSYG